MPAIGNTGELGPARWCVLKCSGRSTLPLMESLAAVGFLVWTPTEMRQLPRRKARRRKPLMEGYIFANSCHVEGLINLSHAPTRERFRIFYDTDGEPAEIPDCQLEPLRTAEFEAIPEHMKPKFAANQGVRFGDGSFSGIAATVEAMKGKFACFSLGPFKVKASPALLRDAA